MWHVYIIECGNSHLYTGATNDVQRRLKMHRAGRGARYTRIFGVKRLVYQEQCGDQSAALKRERQIKRLPRDGKIKLISSRMNRPRVRRKNTSL